MNNDSRRIKSAIKTKLFYPLVCVGLQPLKWCIVGFHVSYSHVCIGIKGKSMNNLVLGSIRHGCLPKVVLGPLYNLCSYFLGFSCLGG